MTVKVGDKLPAGSLKVMGAEGPQEFTISDLFDGKNRSNEGLDSGTLFKARDISGSGSA